ncbi:hypothetical protein [Lysobacter auxotrophicus]|uniref:Tellurite resistance protein TerB n=1 Tax=Lysobacter auxotrophicus TaxID=2992573 RepID=A0ABM8D9F6_9GAMM|nr:hypothetical protein [Lysobacter auxotrophicus]BDU15179.1 hypothetical protein LA521A_03800 [Lysobacter auxotrophicus]
MSKENRDFLEMAFHSIQCFGDDGRLDAAELGRILAIAERNGVTDDNERRVLGNIIARIRPEEIDAAMKAQLDAIARKFGIAVPASA